MLPTSQMQSGDTTTLIYLLAKLISFIILTLNLSLKFILSQHLITNTVLHTLPLIFIISLTLLILFIARLINYYHSIFSKRYFLQITPPKQINPSLHISGYLFNLTQNTLNDQSFFTRLLPIANQLSFEIFSTKTGGIKFYVSSTKKNLKVIKNILTSYQKDQVITEINDPLTSEFTNLNLSEFKLVNKHHLPLQNSYPTDSFDPISYLLQIFTNLNPEEIVNFQIIITKSKSNLLASNIRLFTNQSVNHNIKRRLTQAYLNTLTNPEQKFTSSNTFIKFWAKLKLTNRIPTSRKIFLESNDLATIYHFVANEAVKPVELLRINTRDLPIPLSRQNRCDFDVNFAEATNETSTPIGLTLNERMRHVYIVGATGTGKSTLLLNMAAQDMKNGKGICVIDPHGDLVQDLLNLVPSNRLKDVIYFNPDDFDFPVGLNLLELSPRLSNVLLQKERDLIVSSLISIFHKLYPPRYSGPRMDYILRNAALTALQTHNPTIFTIHRLITDKNYRNQVVSGLNDPILKDFWTLEFDKYGSYQRSEIISPITNKIGRFLTSETARNILGQNKSKINFDQILDGNKILLCDLSKGKIGEDISEILGLLIITKLQLATLKRSIIPVAQRKNFFLYVDEFQNYATATFAQILSESRKYGLAATLAHQTFAQIDDSDLIKVILANSGTLISFRTNNPSDESVIISAFGHDLKAGEIMSLPTFNFLIRINALEPEDVFKGRTNRVNSPVNEDIKKIIAVSRHRYGQSRLLVEQNILNNTSSSRKIGDKTTYNAKTIK